MADVDGTAQLVVLLDWGLRRALRHRAEPTGHVLAPRNRCGHLPIDVLRRVGRHPASRVAELTLRL